MVAQWIWLHVSDTGNNPRWTLFFFAQQHGNEPAGKDALLYMLQYLSKNPGLLPPNIELWIMPMINPDGAVQNKQRNAADADLNRAHLLLEQPETWVLHQIYKKIKPHVAVDCHEFSRDSEGYSRKGWLEWPEIMMDCANNPLLHPGIYQSGKRW
ncbi:MAG: hypothetical protein GF313_04750 [Caldithrix sp.]|nr:hypothetical protein [Caldithrix sp.]